MLVEEVAPVVDVEFVCVRTELDVAFCLLHPRLELEHLHPVVFIHNIVQFLQLGEQGTRRRPNDHARLVPLDRLPASVPVLFVGEVVADVDPRDSNLGYTE